MQVLTLQAVQDRYPIGAASLTETVAVAAPRSRRARARLWGRVAKRALDIALSATALLVLLPVVVVLAAIVRLDSQGPALFRQPRVGLAGREFMMLKFRSMVQGAEQLKAAIEDANEADGLLFKMANDPRVTRVGSWLRRYSLDEIPQLLNVLRGEMSLVGPRPALPSEVAAYDAQTAARLTVKPGLTGPWQVSDRHRSSFEDYVRLDLDYVQSWSVTGDLALLARTVPAVLRPSGV